MRLKLITNDNERDFDELLPDVFMGRNELLGVACIEEAEEEDLWTLDPSMEEDDRLEDAENNRDNTPSGTWILKQFLLERGFLTRLESPIYSFLFIRGKPMKMKTDILLM